MDKLESKVTKTNKNDYSDRLFRVILHFFNNILEIRQGVGESWECLDVFSDIFLKIIFGVYSLRIEFHIRAPVGKK